MERAPHELTELAVALEYDVLAAVRSATTTTRALGRFRGTRPGILYGPSADQIQVQGAYLRAVCITEAYVDAVSADIFDRQIRAKDRLLRKLADSAIEQAEDTWPRRTAAFKRFHDIDIATLQEYKDLAVAIVIRNAIAHGLGALTRRQRNAKTRAQIAAAGVSLKDDRLVLASGDLQTVCEQSVSFIRKVDSLLPPPPSRLRSIF